MEKYYTYRIKTLTCPSCSFPQKVKWRNGLMFVEQICEGCGELVRFHVPNSRDDFFDTVIRHAKECRKE